MGLKGDVAERVDLVKARLRIFMRASITLIASSTYVLELEAQVGLPERSLPF